MTTGVCVGVCVLASAGAKGVRGAGGDSEPHAELTSAMLSNSTREKNLVLVTRVVVTVVAMVVP